MNAPRFSVIVPTYNRSAQLTETIQSVLKQEEKNYELIIIDDGSTDQTPTVVEHFLSDPRIKYHRQENKERGAARNMGATLAKGDYLNFFDSDDLMYSNHLLAAEVFLKEAGEVNFFHTCYRVTDDSGDVVAEEFGEDEKQSMNRLIQTNYLSCDSVFVKRDFFLQHKFNEDRKLSTAEDWELWLRLISRTKLLRCREITFEIRNHGGRSLFNIPPERIVERDAILLASLFTDRLFVEKFMKDLPIFKAQLYAFGALAFSQHSNKKHQTIYFLTKAMGASIGILKKKRFWAAVKHLMTKLP